MAQKLRETTDQLMHDVRQTTERWWGATQRAAGSAGARATGVRKRAQCKLDLSAVRRKISARCSELGRAVYQANLQGDPAPLIRDDVARLLDELEVLHQREETLAHELATSAGRSRGGPTPETEDELHL